MALQSVGEVHCLYLFVNCVCDLGRLFLEELFGLVLWFEWLGVSSVDVMESFE